MNEQQSTELEQEVIDLINSGNKIDAIKMLRELRNIGLKESKEIVDAYVDGTSNSNVSGTTKATTHTGIKRSGSSNKVIFMAIGVFVIYLIYKQFIG